MSQTYTLCEIKRNDGKNGKPIWIVVKGVVYDITKFVQQHPGGEDVILECAGKDATKAFNQVGHSMDAIHDMKLYKIGIVANECMTHIKSIPESVVISTPPKATDAKSSTELPKQCCGKPENTGFKILFCC